MKRNAIIITIASAIKAKPNSCTTPNQKKIKMIIAVTRIPPAIIPIGRSLCVLKVSLLTLCFPVISFTAREKALLIIFDDLIIPITPAIAIPPIPIGLT